MGMCLAGAAGHVVLMGAGGVTAYERKHYMMTYVHGPICEPNDPFALNPLASDPS